MKDLRTTLPELYAKWMNTGWTILTGRPPQANELTLKETQVAADQEWEEEGGSAKAPKKPGTQSAAP